MGSRSHDCSNSAGLLDSYPALLLYLAGDTLHQQPMGSKSHDYSSYVGCGGIPCSTLVSPNASLHKWQQVVAPGWPPYMVHESGFRPAQSQTKAGGFRFRFSSNLSLNSVVIMSSLTVAERAIGAVVGGIIADAAGKLNYCKISDRMREPILSLRWACLKSWPRTVILHFLRCVSMTVFRRVTKNYIWVLMFISMLINSRSRSLFSSKR